MRDLKRRVQRCAEPYPVRGSVSLEINDERLSGEAISIDLCGITFRTDELLPVGLDAILTLRETSFEDVTMQIRVSETCGNLVYAVFTSRNAELVKFFASVLNAAATERNCQTF